MEDSEIIISGPEYSGPEYYGSVAEYMIPKMKSHPKDCILQVDCETNETITAGEFLHKSLEIAEGLIKLGLTQSDVVISACSNSIRSHIATIGVLLSGSIFAPIDQTLKSAELQHFFKLFQPKFIMCERKKVKEIQKNARAINIDSKIIIIDSSDGAEEFLNWEAIRTPVDVDNYIPRKVTDSKKDIALLICSSGSTGLPKGVELSHYSVLFNFALLEKIGLAEPNQGFLLTSPLFWISGTLLTINACYVGQTRYIPKSTASGDILQGIEKFKPFFLMLSPSCLLELVCDQNFKKFDVSSVKFILTAGAVLSPAVTAKVKFNCSWRLLNHNVREFKGANTETEACESHITKISENIWNNIIIANCYGLTEACGGITAGSASENSNAVGKLLPEIKVKVVDLDTGKSLGPNKLGECKIKTRRLMNGYYKNEKATKEALDENGWLCTGDLLYYDEENVFYVCGRNAETITYLNYKISPVYLESFIIGLPGIKDVAVVAVPHETDTNHLKAIVVKDYKYDITAEDIIRNVKENFTERYHLKEGVDFVEALPRSEVGKLRRLEVQKMIKVTKTQANQENGYC